MLLVQRSPNTRKRWYLWPRSPLLAAAQHTSYHIPQISSLDTDPIHPFQSWELSWMDVLNCSSAAKFMIQGMCVCISVSFTHNPSFASKLFISVLTWEQSVLSNIVHRIYLVTISHSSSFRRICCALKQTALWGPVSYLMKAKLPGFNPVKVVICICGSYSVMDGQLLFFWESSQAQSSVSTNQSINCVLFIHMLLHTHIYIYIPIFWHNRSTRQPVTTK